MIDELKENKEYGVDLIYTFRENHIVDKNALEKISKVKNLKFTPWNSAKERNHKCRKDD